MKENLFCGIGMIIFLPLIVYFEGDKSFQYDWLIFKILFWVLLLWNIPAIILLIHYYLQNKNSQVVIDIASDLIKISENGIEKKYKLSDIEDSTYNIGIYYKNALDKAARFRMLISDFGYWDIRFVNGDRFYLKALMIDFLHERPFLTKTKFRYRFIPFIDKSFPNRIKEHEKKENLIRTEMFIKQYKNKTRKQLNYILENQSKYQKEAVKAAKILIEKNIG